MSATEVGQFERLKFLLDSNIFIALEPYSGELEDQFAQGARFHRLVNELGHLLCVAPATRDDLLRGKDADRRQQRVAELGKFHLLEEVPISQDLAARAGASEPGTNDARDLRLLAAVDAGAVTYLVTNDVRLRRRAGRARLADSVLSLSDAIAMLAAFKPDEAPPPPRVARPKTYALRTDDPIFDGLRAEYEGFDDWLARVRRESDTRRCLVVEEDGRYAAIALLKSEVDGAHGLPEPVVKISTFKVADEYSGLKYGELLLKAVLADLPSPPPASLFVEVLEAHPETLAFLGDFGFVDGEARTNRGEHVLVKHLRPAEFDTADLTDLEYHVRFGPPALRCGQQIFVVPIEPRWHDQLFPERSHRRLATQLSLFPESQTLTHPWGNALRKAYLCHSPTNSVRAGDVLLFYRSKDERSVSAIAIVEDTLRSTDPHQVIQFVGRRTVYTPDEIVAMTRRAGGILAVRFRQDRFLEPPLAQSELQAMGAFKAWPQSITRVPVQANSVIRALLAE